MSSRQVSQSPQAWFHDVLTPSPRQVSQCPHARFYNVLTCSIRLVHVLQCHTSDITCPALSITMSSGPVHT